MVYGLRVSLVVLGALTAGVLSGCSNENSGGATGEQGALPPARVTVTSATPETVTIIDELPGRVAAFRTAEIRPQVGGIIEKRLFEQGSKVEAGQPLFQINPEPFKAEVESAAAALQRAGAVVVRAQAKFERSKAMVGAKAISVEAYDEAVADLAQAKAGVAEAKATLQRRQLDLAFATVKAPISGHIGQALVSEGALVSASGTNALAIVQQIDKVYVDVRQPASQIDVIRDAAKSSELDDRWKIPVAIFSVGGKPYPVWGRTLFSEISVDPGTGNVTVRVEVDNPAQLLLPGMYVRARLPRAVRRDALLVPQEAVVRDPAGRPQLVVAGGDRHGERRDVELGETVDGRIIATSGIKAGETVVVQGQDRVRDGALLETVPFTAGGNSNATTRQ
ncbi:efflux RND transporter periplasmic adaptor subunit [Rhizobium sp. WYJ-E13]|uniref:efflux RND transporter periplasmic adaptor subunit n=1 Tax=Rhizobium sp. WYJ-E13 TaxID=2849093 RepID=UPI001C1EA7EA|nr:efflux RND transporter periplasmic adaptor subunit [Rhizobium sp. WYJ-E13]QWW71449.1 efflux RND transporter periplasmic adaptor subunit [Rhizobium sp. WYJ-E13]